MLRLINIYLIIASAVNLYFFFKMLYASFPSVDASGLFLMVLVIAAVGYCLYSNAVLLLGKNEHKTARFLQYNFWYNIFQVPGVSVLGFVYFFSAGMEVVPYIINNGDLHMGCRFDLFNAKGSFYFDPNKTTYFIWVNLVPLAISVFLHNVIQKHQRVQKDGIATIDNNTLNEIQKWFKSQCNGDWEHNYGLTIETLDNPGWHVTIDLKDTILPALPDMELRVEKNEKDWYMVMIRDGKFTGSGDPLKLEIILQKFLELIQKDL